jgi:DNA-directed RNA polymerase specialized sigma24 family protein
MKEQRVIIFNQVLERLRHPLRDVVLLCALGGQSYDTAAEVLKISRSGVRAALNMARLEIARALQREVFTPGVTAPRFD